MGIDAYVGWLVSCGIMTYCLHKGPGPEGWSALREGLFKESYPIFTVVLEKITETPFV